MIKRFTFIFIVSVSIYFLMSEYASAITYIDQDTILTNNVYDSIDIVTDNIIFDCNNFNIVPSDYKFGIRISNRQNITVKNCNLYGSNNAYGIYLNESFNNKIIKNNINNNGFSGVWVYKSDYNEINENNLINNAFASGTSGKDGGIVVNFSNGNIIKSNILDNTNRVGMNILNSNYNNVSNNIIANSNDQGLQISNSNFNEINENIVKNNYNGVYITADSSFNNLNENQILSNKINGVVIWGGYGGGGIILEPKHNKLFKNIITNNKSKGILIGYSMSIDIISNLIRNNLYLNLLIENASDVKIKENTISDSYSREGVYIFSSSDLIISNNNIFYNTGGINLGYNINNIIVYNNNIYSNRNYNINSVFSIELSHNQQGNYWGHNSLLCFYKYGGSNTPYDSNRVDVIDSYPYCQKDGWFLPKQLSQFWSQVQNAPNWLRVRSDHNLNSNIIEAVPNGWAIKIIATKDNNGQDVDIDGYRWYQVYDATDNTTGWMAAKKLSDGTVYLDYNPSLQGDSTNKGELEQKATDLKDILEKRIPVILNAVTDYYTKDNSDSSLYGGGGGDGNNNFQRFIQGSAFPKELVLAIASQESGPSFNNEICSGANDGGIGIMQITSNELKGLGSGLDNKLHKNDCRSGESFSKYYSNTYQGIWANIKDGFRALQGKYDSVGVTQEVDNISALEMKAISTTYRYNQGSPYKVQAVYAIYDGENNDYAWNEYLHYVFNRTDADVWAQSVRNACASAASFASCLNITENLRLTTSAFYLRDVGGRLKSSPFGESYQNSILGEKLITANTSKIIAFLRSPAELVAINSLGERTGIARGNILQNISNSSYEEDKNLLTIFFPRENYIYRVTGTATGEYGFSANFFRGNDIIVFDGRDIPIKLQEIHDYIFDWDKMSYCEQGAVTLKIDYEGDGVYDRIIINDCKIYDIEPPQITISPIENEYLLNSTLQINFSATDNLSGVSSIVATLNGAEITNGQILILTKPGINTLKISATDNEGNEAILEKTFNVMYNFGGFLPPIKIDGTGVYNLGRTLPVKFQLSDVNGNFVSTASAQLYVAKISDGIIGNDEIPLSTSSADTDNQFRYDLTNNQYIYNLSTGILTIGSWQLKAVLDSGRVYMVSILIR